MTWGKLTLIGLLALAGALWATAPGEMALTAPAEHAQDRGVLAASRFPATQCGSCHSEQFREWSQSFHARSLTSEGFLRTFPQYLDFVGNKVFSDRKIRGRMKTNTGGGFWIFPGSSVYQEDKFEEDAEMIVAFYRDRGYEIRTHDLTKTRE